MIKCATKEISEDHRKRVVGVYQVSNVSKTISKQLGLHKSTVKEIEDL